MRSFHSTHAFVLALCASLCCGSLSYGDEREEIKLRIQEIRKQAAQLLEEGRKDKAAGLMREQQELMGKLERMNSEGKQQGRGANPEQLKNRIQQIKRQAAELIEDGRKDEANALLREQKNLIQVLEQIEQRNRPEPQAINPEQMEKFHRAMQRVEHLRIASEHLKQAEMHDMAMDLMRRAEDIEQDLRNAKQKMEEQIRRSKEPARDQPQPNRPSREQARREQNRTEQNRGEQPSQPRQDSRSPESRGQEGPRPQARGPEARINGIEQQLERMRNENRELRMMIEKLAQRLER